MTIITLLPENAVVENHGDLRTTSLKVAEAFGKQHKDVIRKLETLDCSYEFNERNFALVDYDDEKIRAIETIIRMADEAENPTFKL